MTHSVLRRWGGLLLDGCARALGADPLAGVPAETLHGVLRGRLFVNVAAVEAWADAAVSDARERRNLLAAVLPGERTPVGARSLGELFSTADRMLWRVRGLEAKARRVAEAWNAAKPLPESGASLEELVAALLAEERAFRSVVSASAEVSTLLALLETDVRGAGGTAAGALAADPAWLAAGVKGMLQLGGVLAGAPRLREALAGTEVQLVNALFAHREVGQQLDAWLETMPWLADDPLSLEAPRWNDEPVLVLKRAAAWCERSEELSRTARAAAAQPVASNFKGSWAERRFLAWAASTSRTLRGPAWSLRQGLNRAAGRLHVLLRRIGEELQQRGVLSEPADVFQLSWEEVVGWVTGTSAAVWLRETASYRKAEWSVYRGSTEGVACVETLGAVNATNPLRGAVLNASDGARFKGQSISAGGTVKGRVRLVMPGDCPEAQPGEILVAERTTPGWLLAVPGAAAVVSELDGSGSTLGAACRQLGKPMLVRTAGVSTLLRTGDFVEVDGAAGTVARIAEPKEDAPAPSKAGEGRVTVSAQP